MSEQYIFGLFSTRREHFDEVYSAGIRMVSPPYPPSEDNPATNATEWISAQGPNDAVGPTDDDYGFYRVDRGAVFDATDILETTMEYAYEAAMKGFKVVMYKCDIVMAYQSYLANKVIKNLTMNSGYRTSVARRTIRNSNEIHDSIDGMKFFDTIGDIKVFFHKRIARMSPDIPDGSWHRFRQERINLFNLRDKSLVACIPYIEEPDLAGLLDLPPLPVSTFWRQRQGSDVWEDVTLPRGGMTVRQRIGSTAHFLDEKQFAIMNPHVLILCDLIAFIAEQAKIYGQELCIVTPGSDLTPNCAYTETTGRGEHRCDNIDLSLREPYAAPYYNCFAPLLMSSHYNRDYLVCRLLNAMTGNNPIPETSAGGRRVGEMINFFDGLIDNQISVRTEEEMLSHISYNDAKRVNEGHGSNAMNNRICNYSHPDVVMIGGTRYIPRWFYQGDYIDRTQTPKKDKVLGAEQWGKLKEVLKQYDYYAKIQEGRK